MHGYWKETTVFEKNIYSAGTLSSLNMSSIVELSWNELKMKQVILGKGWQTRVAAFAWDKRWPDAATSSDTATTLACGPGRATTDAVSALSLLKLHTKYRPQFVAATGGSG
jgi:hypothetical protein